MTVRLGPYSFEDVEYDADSDILYLRTGEPVPTIGDDTDEGHVICFAEADRKRVVGFDLFNPRALIEREGRVPVTLPGGDTVEARGIESAIAGPQKR